MEAKSDNKSAAGWRLDNSYARLPDTLFSRAAPVPVAQPGLAVLNETLAAELGLDPSALQKGGAEIFAGNLVPEGAEPIAQAYAGHQFGHFTNLGDGRAILLGEQITPQGARFDIQLKGSGQTPYSRRGDGRAALGPMLREYIISEAMHALGIPTTRSLAVATTGEQIVREEMLQGAVLTRVAASHIRVGTFEYANAIGDRAALEALTRHALERHYPALAGADNPALALLGGVLERQAKLIAQWLCVGFVHGVMNTDNMSILGLTIDYGPYGWLEDYDPDWTPNTTDATGRRYRFGQQPQIAMWNLVQLANALAPLFDSVEPLQAGIDLYASHFDSRCQAMMTGKLGLTVLDTRSDKALTDDLLSLMQAVETDMTIFYRQLAMLRCDLHPEGGNMTPDDVVFATLMDAWYKPEQLTDDYRSKFLHWIRCYQARTRQEGICDAVRADRMNAVNPKYVLRNYLAQLAIDKATQGDVSMIAELLDVLRSPFEEQPGHEHLAAKRPDWARHRAGCSMLSCSS